ncbi:TadE family type IV pilus minor pilin [Lolliginicoccus levis]|uniref:TadE family type IV pilus minor pilin n=1 Tax=Lolliginicoccus levis TaxID=2919542 RepID=UPI00241D12E2|nr:TadE family type IV pilus minor pilin [Lolliginicoccus levis]
MTVETALAMAILVMVIGMCVGVLGVGASYVRCIDAAREVALVAARDEQGRAVDAGARLAPGDATISIADDGMLVTARVTLRPAMLPGLTLTAESIAAIEPGRRQG